MKLHHIIHAISSSTDMNAATFLVLSTMFNLHPTGRYNPDALEYALKIIEYQVDVHPGVFRVIFYDIAPCSRYNRSLFDDLLESSRLNHVAKVVIRGPVRSDIWQIGASPEMLIIHPGYDGSVFQRHESWLEVEYVAQSFNPTTKVLILVDYGQELLLAIHSVLNWARYSRMVFLDINSLDVSLCNTIFCNDFPSYPPEVIYSWMGRYMAGWNISYFGSHPLNSWNFAKTWVEETARYLFTEAVEYRHYCEYYLNSRDAFEQCLESQRDALALVDIDVRQREVGNYLEEAYKLIFTNIPVILKIAIPKDRPLNVAEILLMPFYWHVWLLLLTVFGLTELLKRIAPDLLKNDPTLLVICGFERYSLHKASRFEQATLFSLIILMFFLTNSFETKIISLMINKPSIQRIKTIEDLASSDIRFYAGSSNSSGMLNLPVIHRLTIPGSNELHEVIPGIGMLFIEMWLELLDVYAYDYDRMQPFYQILDERIMLGTLMYSTSWRNPFVESFQIVHQRLVEAGIRDLMHERYCQSQRADYVGKRLRVSLTDKLELDFDDIKPAWMALLIGQGFSLVAFGLELVAKAVQWFGVKRSKRKIHVTKTVTIKVADCDCKISGF